MLFGCPIWQVGQIVPASEIPYWQAHFAAEPWGFHAQDMLLSKTAHQIAVTSGRLSNQATYHDFMFVDAFESGDLTKAQFDALSPLEQAMYVDRQVATARKVFG